MSPQALPLVQILQHARAADGGDVGGRATTGAGEGEGLLVVVQRFGVQALVVGIPAALQELGEDALGALRRQLERVRLMRRVAGARWQEHDLVFPSSVGTPLEGRQMWGEFLAVLEKAGVRRVRFHELRHTAATLALRQRVPAKVVQERLGHSRVEVTLNVYSHVIEDMQAEAAVRPVVMALPTRAASES